VLTGKRDSKYKDVCEKDRELMMRETYSEQYDSDSDSMSMSINIGTNKI